MDAIDLVADAMYGLGWTYEKLEQLDEAEAIYDRFLKQFPPTHELTTDIKLQKGETLLAKKLYKEAMPWFEVAAKTEGFASVDRAIFQMATCSFELKDFENAAERYLLVVKNYP